jgi:IS5 family transposase
MLRMWQAIRDGGYEATVRQGNLISGDGKRHRRRSRSARPASPKTERSRAQPRQGYKIQSRADKCKAMRIGIKKARSFGLIEVGMVIARVIDCPADMESSQITSIQDVAHERQDISLIRW